MGEIWIKEAEDLRSSGQSGQMARNHSGVKVTWHVTVSPSGGSMFNAMHGVLTRNKSEPHILYDPVTDRLGQYFPLNRGGRALGNDGSRPTNRDGAINIQIEVVAMPDGFTRYWKPGPNYRALLRAIRSWGIPDTWPAGQLSQSANHRVSRSWADYVKSGHFGHAQVPGNSHWDPGPIDQGAIFTAAGGGSKPGASSAEKAPAPAPVKKYTREDVARFQRFIGVDDDSVIGPQTRKQAAAIRRTLKKGVRFGRWDLVRYYRMKFSRPKDSRTSDDMRRGIQWALGVTVDGDWREATDQAFYAMLKS